MQLREPTQYTDERFKLFDLYKNTGYEGVEVFPEGEYPIQNLLSVKVWPLADWREVLKQI